MVREKYRRCSKLVTPDFTKPLTSFARPSLATAEQRRHSQQLQVTQVGECIWDGARERVAFKVPVSQIPEENAIIHWS